MEITSSELKEKIENGEKLIIDFYTDWCNPCRTMKPIFLKVSEKLRNENSEVQLYTINAEKNRDITVNYGVRSVPTIKSFNGGEEVESRTGILQEQQLNEMATTLLNG